MRVKTLFLLPSIILASFVCGGCSDIVPIWRGEIVLNDYTLYYSDYPREFTIEIDDTPEFPLRLEFEVTFYKGIGRNVLPLFMVLEDSENNVQEFNTSITLREGNEWVGSPEENEIDYTLTHNVINQLELKKGSYSLKIYADDEQEEKIYGVVKIFARLYETESFNKP